MRRLRPTRLTLRAGLLVCATGVLLAVGAPGRIQGSPARRTTLTFSERVEAHRAIEEVLWRHRIWPEGNQGPKPPLSMVLDDRTLTESVRDILRKSTALETIWNQPITPGKLQAELDRMARQSEDRQTLEEMFAALHGDPLLAAEILARQLLADRLLRSAYSSDDRFHGEIRRRARAALAGNPDSEIRALADRYEERTLVLEESPAAPAHRPGGGTRFLDRPDWDEAVRQLAARLSMKPATENAAQGNPGIESILASLPVGRISRVEENEEGLSAVVLLENSPGLLRFGVATWTKVPFDSWWLRVRDGLSDSVQADAGPYILPDSAPSSSCTNDTWAPTGGPPSTTPPSPRRLFTMIWTGAEMIVWGGDAFGPVTNTGGRYNPATASWIPTSTTGAPTPRSDHTAVWTGTRMVIWGGTESPPGTSTGGQYNPTSDTWTTTSQTNQPASRGGHTAVWSGTQMLVWGGVAGAGIPTSTGGRYDPATDTWSAMSTPGLAGRWLHSSIWTGTQMIVYGGRDAPGPAQPFGDGGRYDPVTDGWSTFYAPFIARRSHTAVWDGSGMIVWGGDNNHGNAYGDGFRFVPATGSFSAVSTVSATPRTNHVAVWTGNEMIVWGGWPGVPNPLTATGARYRPDVDAWVGTTTSGAPVARIDHQAVWVSTRMIIWGGDNGGVFDTGGVYCACRGWTSDADGDGHGNLNLTPATTCDGTRPPGLFAYGDCNDSNPAIHPGAFDGNCNNVDEDCDLVADDDYVAPIHSCGLGVCMQTGPIVCVSGQLQDQCIPGPQEESVDLTCDARDGDCDGPVDEDYLAVPDSWTATPASPEAAFGLAAVWSGSELLAWSGSQNGNLLDFGQRYSPATNSWDVFYDPLGLEPRQGHSAVWTGDSMILWGGEDGFQYFADGDEFHPASGQWDMVDNTSAPVPRSGHTAVWTGSTMIVWGGRNEESFLRDGGVYEPTSPFWAATRLTGAPTARTGHTAVWTGSRMVVWGGLGGSPGSPLPLATGSRYNPGTDSWSATSTTGAPSARSGHTAIWTGTQMIVWGGTGASGLLADGGRYDPTANTWSALPTIGAPPARWGHTAVWTGSQMIVWGGMGASGRLADGKIYDPAANAWFDLSGIAAPAARGGASAVWTGSEMIVWGGENGAALASGGRYRLQTICGLGPCQAIGQSTCSGGVLGFACVPGPTAPEVCDGIDNDCDDIVDNNVPVPGGGLAMSATWDPSVGFGLSWGAIPNASSYDMVVGSVASLHATGGDFSLSTFGCVLDDYPSTSVSFGLIGDGYWFLVRGVNACSGRGTYDGPGASQVGARDPEMVPDCP